MKMRKMEVMFSILFDQLDEWLLLESQEKSSLKKLLLKLMWINIWGFKEDMLFL